MDASETHSHFHDKPPSGSSPLPAPPSGLPSWSEHISNRGTSGTENNQQSDQIQMWDSKGYFNYQNTGFSEGNTAMAFPLHSPAAPTSSGIATQASYPVHVGYYGNEYRHSQGMEYSECGSAYDWASQQQQYWGQPSPSHPPSQIASTSQRPYTSETLPSPTLATPQSLLSPAPAIRSQSSLSTTPSPPLERDVSPLPGSVPEPTPYPLPTLFPTGTKAPSKLQLKVKVTPKTGKASGANRKAGASASSTTSGYSSATRSPTSPYKITTIQPKPTRPTIQRSVSGSSSRSQLSVKETNAFLDSLQSQLTQKSPSLDSTPTLSIPAFQKGSPVSSLIQNRSSDPSAFPVQATSYSSSNVDDAAKTRQHYPHHLHHRSHAPILNYTSYAPSGPPLLFTGHHQHLQQPSQPQQQQNNFVSEQGSISSSGSFWDELSSFPDLSPSSYSVNYPF